MTLDETGLQGETAAHRCALPWFARPSPRTVPTGRAGPLDDLRYDPPAAMSVTNTPRSRASINYAGETRNGTARIATKHQVAWFEAELEHDPAICNNCFAKRDDDASYFRALGGAVTGGPPWAAANADRFCTVCEAGMAVPPREAPSYFRGADHLPPAMHSEMAGTVGREWGNPDRDRDRDRDWGKDEPLPKTGGVVSLSRIITRVGQRLEDRGYVVEWDAARDLAEELKNRHANRDRVILARVFAEHSHLRSSGVRPRAASVTLDALAAD